MTDNELINQALDRFYEDQHRGATERVSRGGPVGDIRSALASIRQVLPEHEDSTLLPEWLALARQALEAERQRFRQENEDEAGWGSATFVELQDLLVGLQNRREG
jgi:hypothetical protein